MMINGDNVKKVLDNWDNDLKFNEWLCLQQHNTWTGKTQILCIGDTMQEMQAELERRVCHFEPDYAPTHTFYNITYTDAVSTHDEIKATDFDEKVGNI